eukprot:4602954-Amphidinium_carterae.2
MFSGDYLKSVLPPAQSFPLSLCFVFEHSQSMHPYQHKGSSHSNKNSTKDDNGGHNAKGLARTGTNNMRCCLGPK